MRREGADPRVVGVLGGIVVVIVGLVLVGLLTSGRDRAEVSSQDGTTSTSGSTAAPTPQTPPSAPAQPTGPGTDPAGPPSAGDDAPTPAPDDGEGADGEGGVPEPGAPRSPTDGDAAGFAAGVAGADADARSVQADLDGDGTPEVVVASVLGGQSRIDVGGWTGTGYAVVFSGEGGAADALRTVRVQDINGVPDTLEIVVRQASGTAGESIAVWGQGDGGTEPLRAIGGCWDGSHVYGIVGVTLGSDRITATCDGSPAPLEAWPSDVYAWDPAGAAFTYERTLA